MEKHRISTSNGAAIGKASPYRNHLEGCQVGQVLRVELNASCFRLGP